MVCRYGWEDGNGEAAIGGGDVPPGGPAQFSPLAPLVFRWGGAREGRKVAAGLELYELCCLGVHQSMALLNVGLGRFCDRIIGLSIVTTISSPGR